MIFVPLARIAESVFKSILLPLALGILLRQLAPRIADLVAKPFTIAAWVVLVAALVPVIVAMWPVFQAMIGSGVTIALIAFTVIGTVAGHLLGGPDADDRTVLALASGARHPGVAMAIATSATTDVKPVLALILFHLLIATIVVAPYVASRKRLHMGAPA